MIFDAKNPKPILPFGVVTLVLVVSVLLAQWLFVEDDACAPLKERLDYQSGYFLRWQAPNLMLITRDKQQWNVQADSEAQACKQLHKLLVEEASKK